MNTVKEHGISVGISRIGEYVYMQMSITGKLEHEDYVLMVPMLENAIAGIQKPKIEVLVDATDFEGWALEAAWDDLKFGMKHKDEFTKIAFVGNKKWEEYGIKVSNWFMSGEMRYFEDINAAKEWIKA